MGARAGSGWRSRRTPACCEGSTRSAPWPARPAAWREDALGTVVAGGQGTSGAKSPSQTGRLVCVWILGGGGRGVGALPPADSSLVPVLCTPRSPRAPSSPFQPWGCVARRPRCPVPGRAEASQPPRVRLRENRGPGTGTRDVWVTEALRLLSGLHLSFDE